MLSLKSERIPRATIRRLAVYVQVLESMQRNGVEVGDYLAYTQMFAQTCLDKTQAEALVPQLEPDERPMHTP